MNFGTSCAWLGVVILLLTGCAGRYFNAPLVIKPKESRGPQETRDSKPAGDRKMAPTSAPVPQTESSTPPLAARLPEVTEEPSITKRIVSELRGRFVIAESSPAALLIRNNSSGRSTPPSLFEEAIVLNKLRGSLKAQGKIPSRVVESTTLRNGTATIPFSSTVSSSVAAEAISKALSVDGVQCVRATF